MPHYKTLLDPGIFIGAQDFPTDKTVKISRIIREKMPTREGEKDEEVKAGVMLYFSAGTPPKELARKYKLPKSVMYGLSLMFGTDTDGWLGKEVTLFATKCVSFGEVEECVRLRFTAEIDKKIVKWLKKRKSNPAAYMITGAA